MASVKHRRLPGNPPEYGQANTEIEADESATSYNELDDRATPEQTTGQLPTAQLSRRIANLIVPLVLGLLVLLVCSSSWGTSRQVIYTAEELRAYDGSSNGRLYLAILGDVFDVSKAKEYYGKGAGYHHFTGRDGSRAFITGDFKGDLTDNTNDFTNEQFRGLVNWRSFYHKTYIYKGHVVGAYYDARGAPTPLLREAERKAEQAAADEAAEKQSEARYPRCNVRWTAAEGGSVWCDNNWYPRLIFQDNLGSKPTSRCACFEGIGWSDIRQVYPNCSPDASECRTS